jgi:hypothetical protein
MYELTAALVGAGERFVIRACQDRRVRGDIHARLFEALAASPTRFERQVQLGYRAPKEARSRSRRNQPRESRLARLGVRACTVTIARPPTSEASLPRELPLNYVHVFELDAPASAECVDWKLVTTEPIATREDLERIIDAYRCRWVVEEFIKALKTGCGFQKAQLESLEALERLLAMLLPVAWQLLLLRSLGAEDPDAPAESFLTKYQLKALRVLSETPLEARPTVAQAIAAIAAMGGHIKHNGPPGWQVLGRGMDDLRGAAALLERMDSKAKWDQS